MLTKKIIFYSLISIGVLILTVIAWVSPWSLSLDDIHSGIEREYQNVQHIDSQTLIAMDADNVIIFDVREFDEFNVSHIKGAIQIDPSTEPDDFEYEFSELIQDKVVVFYCSVGVRSSSQASRLANTLAEADTRAVFNLKGGIFQWHNEARPLVKDQSTSTTKVHPYNDYWGRLIQDQSMVSYL